MAISTNYLKQLHISRKQLSLHFFQVSNPLFIMLSLEAWLDSDSDMDILCDEERRTRIARPRRNFQMDQFAGSRVKLSDHGLETVLQLIGSKMFKPRKQADLSAKQQLMLTLR